MTTLALNPQISAGSASKVLLVCATTSQFVLLFILKILSLKYPRRSWICSVAQSALELGNTPASPPKKLRLQATTTKGSSDTFSCALVFCVHACLCEGVRSPGAGVRDGVSCHLGTEH